MTITNTFDEQLFQELDNKVAEKYNGGLEVFTIANPTKYDVTYTIDGRSLKHKPNQVWRWIAFSGGIINFDRDGRKGVKTTKKYNLANRGKYVFRANKKTSNPHDIDLYKIG